MARTVVARMDLGYTRIAGWVLYDSETKEFQEMTPKIVENNVKAHRVNGLVFDEAGELVPDREGWNLGNIKIRSGVGNYRDFNTTEPKGETVYSVVRVLKLNADTEIYEVVNNRCARVFYTAKQLAALAEFNWVGGVRVDHESGEITVCKGVIMESVEDQQFIFEVGSKVYPKDNISPSVDVDEFEKNNPINPASSAQEQADYEFDQITEAFKDKPKTMEELFSDSPVGSVSEASMAEGANESEPVAEEATESKPDEVAESSSDADDSVTDTLKEMYGYKESSDETKGEAEASEVPAEVTETPVADSEVPADATEAKPQNTHKSKKKHK